MINGSKIKLRSKRLSDAREDYTWQTDQELARLDAATASTITFSQYLAEYASELRYPSPLRNRFAIETLEGEHIGNCTYYGIDEAKGEAELGIMIGNRGYWDKGYGTDVVATLANHIFQQTRLSRIYLKTLDSNARAHKCFQKCGFTPYGELKKDGYSFVLMELTRQEWQKRQS
ncbi:MAG TPA: GNAT family N-acetyltransferase [Dehalococcoidia bacterium]|nr:GNAT family N-acetyltransferase [Dehalococcoidia bacterium]